MDRGVVIGGVLICASFLLAVTLNNSEPAPKASVPDPAPAPATAIEADDSTANACPEEFADPAVPAAQGPSCQ